MATPDISHEELLEVIGCDISARPAGAPTPRDLAPFYRGLRREGGQLIVSYDPAVAADVAALADAERRCCSGLGWEVEQGAVTALRVTATPAALDVLEQGFAQGWGLELSEARGPGA